MAGHVLRVALEPVRRPLVVAAVAGHNGRLVPVSQADVLVWDGPLGADFATTVAAAKRVRWVHVWPAGADRIFSTGAYDPSIIWTTSRSAYGDTVAEHALALLLAAMRNLKTFIESPLDFRQTGRTLIGRRVAIVGAGAIGQSLIGYLRPFHCGVTVVRRTPEPIAGVTRIARYDELPDAVAGQDAVVLACPLTRATRNLVDSAVLERMEADSWLINVARGGIVDHDALAAALAAGSIAGAALDVTSPEPLPADHPLRQAPNCLLTPHVGNTWQMSEAPFAERLAENLLRYGSLQPLLGVVSADDHPA